MTTASGEHAAMPGVLRGVVVNVAVVTVIAALILGVFTAPPVTEAQQMVEDGADSKTLGREQALTGEQVARVLISHRQRVAVDAITARPIGSEKPPTGSNRAIARAKSGSDRSAGGGTFAAWETVTDREEATRCPR